MMATNIAPRAIGHINPVAYRGDYRHWTLGIVQMYERGDSREDRVMIEYLDAHMRAAAVQLFGPLVLLLTDEQYLEFERRAVEDFSRAFSAVFATTDIRDAVTGEQLPPDALPAPTALTRAMQRARAKRKESP